MTQLKPERHSLISSTDVPDRIKTLIDFFIRIVFSENLNDHNMHL